MGRLNTKLIPFALVSLSFACGEGLPANDGATAEARVRAAAVRFAAEPPPPQTHATRVRRSSSDRAGDAHVVLDVLRNGHRVLGAEMSRHVLKDGTVLAQNFTDTSPLRFDDAPATVTEAQAVELARAAMADLRARALSVTPELF